MVAASISLRDRRSGCHDKMASASSLRIISITLANTGRPGSKALKLSSNTATILMLGNISLSLRFWAGIDRLWRSTSSDDLRTYKMYLTSFIILSSNQKGGLVVHTVHSETLFSDTKPPVQA